MATREGTLFAGRYRVQRRLGSGAMATVFLAEDERLRRDVAVKRLHAGSSEDVAQRFDREARLGASLNHPNIVSIYDVVAEDDDVLIVMEYVKGWTLASSMARGTLQRERALEILGGVAAALDHAHDHGVIHRDVKPANVLVRTDGFAKLADLGIATATHATQITRAGSVLGTPAYMAPEQLAGGEITAAVDVYALAAVAYEVLSGQKARQGRTPLEIAHKVATEPPPDLRGAWPEAPTAVALALKSGMARDPSERPRSVRVLVRALEVAAQVPDSPAAVSPAPAPSQAVESAPAAAGALAAAHTAQERETVAPARPAEERETVAPARHVEEGETVAPARQVDGGAEPPPPESERVTAPYRVEPRPAPRRVAMPAGPAPRPHRSRRTWLPVAVLLLALAIGGGLLALWAAGDGGANDPEQQQASEAQARAERAERREARRRDAASTTTEEQQAQPTTTGESTTTPEPTTPAPTATTPADQPIDPAAGRQLNDQGFALARAGDHEAAVPVLERAVASFPQDSTDINYAYALFNLGRSLRLSGRADEAVAPLERRLRFNNQRGVVQRELDLAREAAAG